MTAERDDAVPDVRDGLTRLQRVMLWQLSQLQRERGGRRVPTTMLYGRVCEHVCVDPVTFQRTLAKLVGRGVPSRVGTVDPRPMAASDEMSAAAAPRLGVGATWIDVQADGARARADSAADLASDDDGAI